MSEIMGGRYQLVKSLRTTDFCETYIAKDNHLPGSPLCIVKILQPQSNNEYVLQTAKRLFQKEAEKLYLLGSHPQIPRLLAHHQVDERFYLVQEFISGQDLSREEIKPNSDRWDEEKVIDFLLDTLNTLKFVHDNSLIHRDIKPSNLIRRDDGTIVLIDFGAVKEITNATITEGGNEEGFLRGDRTVVVGTPGYMAREQQYGHPHFSSDIYSLGVTTIEGIIGCLPFNFERDQETGEIRWRHLVPDFSPQLGDIIDRMVKDNRVHRYQNVDLILKDLQDLTQVKTKVRLPKPIFKKPTRLSLWIVVVPFALGFVILAPRILNAINAISHYTTGNSLIANGEYERAIEEFDRALKIKPHFTQALTNKGYAQGQLGEHFEKFVSCTDATKINPDFAEAWNCRGLARFDLNKYESAIVEYERAIAIEPNNHNYLFNKGEALLKLKKYEESLDATRKAIAIQKNQYLAWTQICQALFELEQYIDAKSHCQQSLNIEPNYRPTIDLLNKIEEKLN